jgi:hypothetical protein
MEEYIPPSNEVYDKENVVEIKAANFIWDNILDQSSQVNIEKFAKRSSGKCLSIFYCYILM